MGGTKKSEKPKWLLLGTGILSLTAGALVLIVRYHEIQKASAEAEWARIEVELARKADRESPRTPHSPPSSTTTVKASPPESSPPISPPKQALNEPVQLFNGRNLEGWALLNVSYTKDKERNTWAADPERRVLFSRGGDFQDLLSNRQFKNFTLKLDWRFTPGGFIDVNGSGIVVRSYGLDSKGHNPRGIEIDLRDNKNEKVGMRTGCFLAYGTKLSSQWGKADGEKNRALGWLREPNLRPQGQWNSCEINCVGDSIKVWMNGALVNEGWGAEELSGGVCLRSQNTAVEFRDITVTTLDR